MIGRRIAAGLCVLLAHALVIFTLAGLGGTADRLAQEDTLSSDPNTLDLDPPPAESSAPIETAAPAARTPARAPSPATPPPVGESGAITLPERVDWPIEARKSATRVLAAEAEAERIARMFSGPDGTWASLTKRERSRLKKFRWKPGVDGLEYDEKGNAIYHISEGCVVVNLMFIGCSLGKAKVHGDLFNDMRLYFDEQRLPRTDEGNGTEPEALRPAN